MKISLADTRPEAEAHEIFRVLTQVTDDALQVRTSLGSFNTSWRASYLPRLKWL
jgi:hypothetical protein